VPCGKDAYLQFTIGKANLLTLNILGFDSSNQIYSYTVMVHATVNWSPVGTNVQLRRATSIAQMQQNLTDGETFGLNQTTGALDVAWYSWFCNSHLLNAANGAADLFPDATRVVTTPIIRPSSPFDEYEGVSLHQ